MKCPICGGRNCCGWKMGFQSIAKTEDNQRLKAQIEDLKDRNEVLKELFVIPTIIFILMSLVILSLILNYW